MKRYRVAAPAKVNLCLAVGDIRADGYHDVDTVLHALDFADDVLVEPARALELICEPSVGVANERNLAWKAATVFGRVLGVAPLVRITITKRIPHGAGLAGGSSNAAAVLAALATMHKVPLKDPRLIRVAQMLGADTLFFLQGAAAHMTNRGDVLVETLPPLAIPVLIVKPLLPVPTAAAYAAFDAKPHAPQSCSGVIAALKAGDAPALGAALTNNLESSAAAIVPDVGLVLRWMRSQSGVSGALLAGSGSSAFALVSDAKVAENLAREAERKGWWATATSLATVGLTLSEEDVA